MLLLNSSFVSRFGMALFGLGAPDAFLLLAVSTVCLLLPPLPRGPLGLALLGLDALALALTVASSADVFTLLDSVAFLRLEASAAAACRAPRTGEGQRLAWHLTVEVVHLVSV